MILEDLIMKSIVYLSPGRQEDLGDVLDQVKGQDLMQDGSSLLPCTAVEVWDESWD